MDVIIFFAVVGAALGVVNLAHNYLNDSERVRVALIKEATSSVVGIEVANWSRLPITVTEIGTMHGEEGAQALMIDPGRGDVDRLPKRIEARAAHRFPISLQEANAWRVHRPSYTYVRTALGHVFTTEPLRIRWLRNIREALGLKVKDL